MALDIVIVLSDDYRDMEEVLFPGLRCELFLVKMHNYFCWCFRETIGISFSQVKRIDDVCGHFFVKLSEWISNDN